MMSIPKTKTVLATVGCMLILCLGARHARAGEAPAAHYFGFHGPDGTQVYKDANPPVEWDGKSGRNILWQTQLPYLGYGAPVVANDRVFVVCEPGLKSDFPQLVCVDAKDGKILWQKEIDHLAKAVPDEQARQKVAAAWHEHLAWRRERNQLYGELGEATDKAAIQEKIKAQGMEAERKQIPANASPVSTWRMDKEHPEVSKAGLFLDAWRTGFGSWYPGATFATPCTDGEAVYVVTAWRSYACYDLDGNLKWMHWFPSKGKGDWSDGCGACRSPLIWKDLFIADNNGWVRAFERKTGRVAWEVSRPELGLGHHEIMSPVVMTVAGTDLLWCSMYPPHVIRLADGKALKVEGWDSPGMMAVVNTDQPDTVFLTGGGEHGGWEGKGGGNCKAPPPAAVKLSLAGNKVTVTVLWSGVDGKGMPSNCASLAYYGGKLYLFNQRVGGVILDAQTGKALKGLPGPGQKGSPETRAVPATTLHFAIAGGRIYGLGCGEHGSEKRKDDLPACVVGEVFTLDGKKLASNILCGAKIEGDVKAMRSAANNIPNWFSYSNPFVVSGERIYARSCYTLICVGAK